MDNEPMVGSYQQCEDLTVFPWRDGVTVSLWSDGPAYFQRLLSLIGQSKSWIFVELYWFASGRTADRFINAFALACARGVQVYCLLDHVGSRDLSVYDRNRLRRSGVKLVFYNPIQPRSVMKALKRDHRKVWIFDGHSALLGGPGIADVFMGTPTVLPWRDVLFELQGPIVADFVEYGRQFWSANGGVFSGQLEQAGHRSNSDEGVARWCVDRASLVLSWGKGRQHIKRHGLKRIRSADKEIILMTGYFYPTWKLRRALRDAAKRGVLVKLLLPGAKTDHPFFTEAGRYYYRYLLRHGVKIFEYQPRFQHVKLLLCDDWVCFGSSNQDRWNQRWNLEANVECQSQSFALEIKRAFEKDFLQARAIEWASWRQRRWWSRVRTYLIYRITLIIETWLAGRS